uniref:DUF4794 domain-containing protein n=1 Tax=Cuerna arida TaxID=1464854 RepID=A0A1B6GLD3_9HEMI
MVSLTMTGLGVLLVLVAGVSCVVPGFGYPAAYPPPTPPLAIIAESPYSVAKYSARVPLLMVDSNTLTMIRNAEISSVSPTEPLVTCRTGNRYVTEATPAVQVVLKRPMYISPHQNSIQFPAELSVLYGGLRMGLPVGAVVAPVPHQGFNGPHYVRVVYAIPSGPLPLQYPYYDPFSYRAPVYPQTQVLPIAPFQVSYRPSPQYTPVAAPAPQEVSNVIADVKRPKPPTVTVLNFPSALASPEVLYYQPPLDDSELGNRGPPEAIVPAGIVQSSQPIASLESFLNSKESPELSALREQAEKNKDKEDETNQGVESL